MLRVSYQLNTAEILLSVCECLHHWVVSTAVSVTVNEVVSSPTVALEHLRGSSSAFRVLSLVLHDSFNLVFQAGETRPLLEVVCPALLHQTVHLVSQ